MILIKRHNLCFIRVPKNASSAVSDWVYDELCEEEDLVSRAFQWSDDREEVFRKNLPSMPHSHVDAKYAIEYGLVPETAKFIATVRHPIERQLSCYLYRRYRGTYKDDHPLSVEDFRSRMRDGVLIDKKAHHMQSQSSFLSWTKPLDVEWWSFDYIAWHVIMLAAQYELNASTFKKINTSPGNKRELIDIFYTPELKRQVEKAYEKDFELYERTTKQAASLFGVRS